MLIDCDPIGGSVTLAGVLVGHATAIDRPSDYEIAGQHFACTGSRPHVCRDGREVRLYVWCSHCEACGAPYSFTVPSTRTEFEPTRRCKACRRPTSKVAAEERRAERAAKVRALLKADPTLERQFPSGLPDWVIDPEAIR